ncbi:MAG: BatD family protein [Chitinophagaceae bacterium]
MFFLVIAVVFAQAQASFNLKVSDKTIGESDAIQAQYVIANANTFNNFLPPVFNDWQISEGPGYTEQTVIVNNKMERTVSYSYSLTPKKAGDLNVPGTSVTADGKKIICDGITVHVSKKTHVNLQNQKIPQQPIQQLPSLFSELQNTDPFTENSVLKRNENAEDKIRNNMFVKVFANKTSCYVGEPILVTYELFSALQSVSKVDKQPTFSGCSVIEMTTNDALPMQKIDGKMYRVFLIRKVQLIPLQEGELKMDVASVTNDVSFSLPDNPYQTKNYTETLTSNPLSIEVKALPEKNKTANFSGSIGKFAISAKADSISIAKGENNNLHIIISGEGNFQNIPIPTVQWPQSLEHFDETDSQHIDRFSFPPSGNVTFNIPFIGTKEGAITIPEIKFNYFDASAQTYKTVYTDSIKIIVTPALAKNNNFKTFVTEDVTNRKYLWIVPAIALFVCLIFFIGIRNKNKQDAKNKLQQTTNKPQEKEKTEEAKVSETFVPLKIKTDFVKELALLQLVTDNYTFFVHVKILLTQAFDEKLNLKIQTETVLINEGSKQINADILTDAENIYTVCNQCLYSPIISDDLRTSTYNNLASVIEKLELLSQSTYL